MPPRNFTNPEEEQIAKIYLAGHSAKSIARAYGLSHHISIIAALERQGVEQRPPSERNRLYAIDAHVFDVIDNELAAYWWGFLYADGCVSRDKTLAVALKESDVTQLEKLRRFLQSDAPINHSQTKLKNGKSYGRVRVCFTERHLAARLIELGIIARRPNPLYYTPQIPQDLRNHWVRGYFDGDGSARKNPSIVFCGSFELMTWIRNLMAQQARTNPELSVVKHTKSDIYYVYFSGRRVALRVADYLYKDATVWLERKRQVIGSWRTQAPQEKELKGQVILACPFNTTYSVVTPTQQNHVSAGE